MSSSNLLRIRRGWPARVAAVAGFSLLLAGALRTLPAAIPEAGLARAIAAQRDLVGKHPADAAAREDLGSLLALAGDYAGAEASYREAIVLDPASASAHFHLGSTLEQLEEDRAALKEYKAALEIDPAHAWAHYEVGSIYDRRGMAGLAKRSYARAFGFDPTLADPAINPHIVDNRLATAAMILAYRKHLPELSAPKSFHEPARIAGLIVEAPRAADRLAAAAAKPEPPLDEAPAAGGYALLDEPAADRADDAGEEPVDEEEPAKVLTSEDLDPGNDSGQLVGGAVVGGARSTRGLEAAQERAKAREEARRAARATAPATPGDEDRSNNPSHPFPGGTPFLPTPESTGRLEVRLDEGSAG